jgi:hypothetical protein
VGFEPTKAIFNVQLEFILSSRSLPFAAANVNIQETMKVIQKPTTLDATFLPAVKMQNTLSFNYASSTGFSDMANFCLLGDYFHWAI